MATTITKRGPLFDGRAKAYVRAYVDEAEQQLARTAGDDVHNTLHHVLRHPTGYYESHVTVERNEVNDGGVIYGPWLEGTGSRNRTTRFKGYATFRRVAQKLQGKAVRVVEPQTRRLMRRLG